MKIENIKFKAKRLDNSEWVKGYFYQECDNTYIIEDRQKDSILNRNEAVLVDPSTVCQFTGLTDDDYNDIWEGDLICVDEEMEEVTYTDGAFMLGCYYLAEFAYGDNHTDLVRQCSKFDRKEGEK